MTIRTYRGIISAALTAIMLLTNAAFGQITVSPEQTAAAMAQKLAGQGVTIIDPVLNCPSYASGFFSSVGSLPGFDSGIVLTNGRAQTNGSQYGVNGYSTYLASNNNGGAGDTMLNALAGQTTMDACSLEFDMLPLGDTISVDYVFSSEEYIAAVCGPYNDAFAFFISGPGISGNQNIALVPGTNIPVTINTINDGVPGSTGNISNCTSMGPGSPFTDYFVNNSNGTQLTHNGLTTVLHAIHPVDKCSQYHLKIVIADAGNALYDSGVFLKAGSLQTEQFNVSAVVNPVYDTATAVCVKGCLPGRFTVRRSVARPQAQTVKFLLHGSAVSGYDFSPVADSVVIPANAYSADVLINGLPTPVNGTRFLQMAILAPSCDGSGVAVDSASLLIYDSLALAVVPADTSVCRSSNFTMHVTGDDIYTYSWSPANYLTADNVKQPLCTPSGSTVYTLTASLPGSACPAKSAVSSVHVKRSPVLTLTADTTVCDRTTFMLPASLAPPDNYYSYVWSGPGGFTSTQLTPLVEAIAGGNSGVYSLTVTLDTNNCTAIDTIHIGIISPDTPQIAPIIFCLNSGNMQPDVPGNGITWYNANDTVLNGSPNIATNVPAIYQYFVTQASQGCNSRQVPVQIIVEQCCDGSIFIPTAFTPNNDGLNDIFEARPDYGYYVKAVSIYNRWGQLVYSGTEGKWNGKFGAADAEMGTYYYTFSFGCILGGIVVKKGEVQLIR